MHTQNTGNKHVWQTGIKCTWSLQCNLLSSYSLHHLYASHRDQRGMGEWSCLPVQSKLGLELNGGVRLTNPRMHISA